MADSSDFMQDKLLAELEQLREEVAQLRQENADLEVLLEFNTEHSTAIENDLNQENKMVRRELQIGRQIQADFLPESLPDLAGWELAVQFKPARQVAGDFYDAFTLPGGHLAIVVADVCDKGVGAALFMALTRTLIRVLALQAPLRLQRSVEIAPATDIPADVTEILQAVKLTNDYITSTHSRSAMFATLFFGVIDAATGMLYYINAGHDAPVLLGREGVKERLKRSGAAVGSWARVTYKIRQAQLELGDTLLVYTDGIPEAKNSHEEMFSESHLVEILTDLAKQNRLGATNMLKVILDEVDNYVGNAESSDDITLLALHRLV